MIKTLSLVLALFAVSVALAAPARAAGYLTAEDNAYLQSIGSDPSSEWITSLKPAQQRALHNLIAKNSDPQVKKDAVNKFLDNAVAQYLLSLGNSSSNQA